MRKLIVFTMVLLVVLSVAAAYAANDVTFRVKMNVKILEGAFNPATDTLVVRGNFNNWGGYANRLTDADGDSIYTHTTTVFGDTAGREVQYKFVLKPAGKGDQWESVPNRKFTTTGSPLTLPVVYFDDDKLVSVKASGNILFQVDMTPFIQLGIFDRAAGDSVQLRGNFNGWGPANRAISIMERVPGTEIYELTVPFTDWFTYDKVIYKYYMDFQNPAKFPGGQEWWGWELPLTTGGGNRVDFFLGKPDQEVALTPFDDLNPKGIIPAGKTIALTMSIDMRPALTATPPFNPAVDKVHPHWADPLWTWTQGRPQGTDTSLTFTDPDGDMVYALTFNVVGPTWYGIEYAVQYGSANPEGGGFEYGRYRTRYIKPNPDGTFPSNFTFPRDTWTKDPPLLVETPPYPPTGVAVKSDAGVPISFALRQNYPNPFNPSTTIEFSVPTSEVVKVKIYDMLGRVVRELVNKKFAPGTYEVTWDGTNSHAERVASGVYLYRIEAGKFVQTKKMVLLK